MGGGGVHNSLGGGGGWLRSVGSIKSDAYKKCFLHRESFLPSPPPHFGNGIGGEKIGK